jgi:hypothetical protein
MTSMTRQQEAEQRMWELIELGGLPHPDSIEHDEDCIRLYWEESKLLVIVELE